MELNCLQSCTKCGIIIDTEKLDGVKQFPEGTNIYNETTKKILETECAIKGKKFDIKYEGEYFFCPVCNTINEIKE